MVLIVKKIPNGKLIKIEYTIVHGGFSSFKLYGDFFLHPETLLEEIEKSLIGREIENISQTIDYVLSKYKGEFIGVTPQDIQQTIEDYERSQEVLS